MHLILPIKCLGHLRYTSPMSHTPPPTLPAWLGDDVEYVANVPQCLSCVHFTGDGGCAAFPSGIPEAIYLNLADHRKPFPGDQGIRWSPDEHRP